MPGISLLFKPQPEYLTKSSLFKPSVHEPINQTTYDLNNELFDEQTILDLSNTKLVLYSDPHCTTICGEQNSFVKRVEILKGGTSLRYCCHQQIWLFKTVH